MHGYDLPQDILNLNAIDSMIAPQERERLQQIMLARLDGNNVPIQYEYEGQRRDGSAVILLNTVRQVHWYGETAIQNTVIDITKRKIAEGRLRCLSRQLIDTQEQERQRIAMDLHDGIGQLLSGLKFSIMNHLNGTPEVGAEFLENLSVKLEESIVEVRRIAMDLRPAMLDDLGVIATLQWLCDTYRQQHPDLFLTTQIAVQEEDIPEPLKAAIFRISQEALTNIAKHAKARTALLILQKSLAAIELHISDDGQGFVVKPLDLHTGKRLGMGLTTMRERTELTGGDFSITSAPSAGSQIQARWPIS